MKLKPYKTLIALSKEKLDEAMAPIRARGVKAKAELEMSKLEADQVTNETKIQELLTEKDVNFIKLMDLIDEGELVERRLKKYTEVLEQLFPKD